MAKIKIGTMRCPIRAVVTQTGKMEFTIDSTKRCKGMGAVYSDPDRKNFLTMDCPEGKKDEAKWAEVKGDRDGRKKLLENKPIHQTASIDMREDIWASQVSR